MKKYKQKIIPSVKTGELSNNRKSINEYYTKHLQGKNIVNTDTGIRIYFTSAGKGKLSFGGTIHSKKAAVTKCLYQLLKVAEYNNFGQRKIADKSNVLGYLNFKAKVKIDGKLEQARIAVMVKTDGKFYYSHEINTKNKALPRVSG